MRFSDLMRIRDGWLDRRGRCKDFGMPWIFVGSKTLDLMASHSLGVIEDQGTTMFGLDLTGG